MAHHNPMVVANWKMNTSLADATVLTQSIIRALGGGNQADIVLAPPFVWLYPVKEIISALKQTRLYVGAQTMHDKEEGPYTGEISAMMLKRIVDFVLLGHSERAPYGETPEKVNLKVKRALEWNINPIVFAGEESENTPVSKLLDTLDMLLHGVAQTDYHKLTIVYEPVWAISSHAHAHAVTGHGLEVVTDAVRKHVGDEPRILYGGSVTASNVSQFMHIPSVDGVVVGSASLKAKEFVAICSLISAA